MNTYEIVDLQTGEVVEVQKWDPMFAPVLRNGTRAVLATEEAPADAMALPAPAPDGSYSGSVSDDPA